EESVLRTPLQGLSPGQLTDCRWAGEHVGVLAWALGLTDRPVEWELTDVSGHLDSLGFMRDEVAAGLRERAALRPVKEREAYYKRVSLVRWATQEERLRQRGTLDAG